PDQPAELLLRRVEILDARLHPAGVEDLALEGLGLLLDRGLSRPGLTVHLPPRLLQSGFGAGRTLVLVLRLVLEGRPVLRGLGRAPGGTADQPDSQQGDNGESEGAHGGVLGAVRFRAARARRRRTARRPRPPSRPPAGRRGSPAASAGASGGPGRAGGSGRR